MVLSNVNAKKVDVLV